jgi:hypothetical protein
MPMATHIVRIIECFSTIAMMPLHGISLAL